jgi:gliding motility-associated protein GldM
MALPREPRQKMINMMYLVLTALLALNVSSEILNAFKTVKTSLEKTNATIGASTDNVMASLQLKLNDPGTKDKALIWQPKAKMIQDESKKLFDYLQTLKDRILTEAGGDPKDPNKRYKEDNLDIATRIMIEKGEGPALLQKLTDYKNFVLSRDPLIKSKFENSLPINLDKPKSSNRAGKTWEGAYFHMVPTVAALTILSKFQNDVKTSENNVISYCHEQVGKVEVQQDAFTAIAVADATYVLPGQEINVTAGVGGFSTKVSPKISINGQSVNVDANDGTAKLKITSSGNGQHSIPVHIEYTDQNNKLIKVDKTIPYIVGQSNAAVQLDKMNVFFIGVENPITVSGSGSAESLQVYASGQGGAVVTGSGASRNVSVTTETDDCIINVKTSDGKVTPVKFRVRSIPDPLAMVGRNKGGNMPAAQFKAQGGVSAMLENFYYQTQFVVTSFRIIGDGEGFADPMEVVNNGNTWSPQAQTLVNKVRNGSFIYIEDIKCVGPDKRTRSLPPIHFNLR